MADGLDVQVFWNHPSLIPVVLGAWTHQKLPDKIGAWPRMWWSQQEDGRKSVAVSEALVGHGATLPAHEAQVQSQKL